MIDSQILPHCISLYDWLLYFISIFLAWRLGFEPRLRRKRWNLRAFQSPTLYFIVWLSFVFHFHIRRLTSWIWTKAWTEALEFESPSKPHIVFHCMIEFCISFPYSLLDVLDLNQGFDGSARIWEPFKTELIWGLQSWTLTGMECLSYSRPDDG